MAMPRGAEVSGPAEAVPTAVEPKDISGLIALPAGANVAIGYGVRATEDPDQPLVHTVDRDRANDVYHPYGGVELPFHYFSSLVAANVLAAGGSVTLVGFGHNRLARELNGDADNMRAVLEGRGSAKDQDFYNKIAKAELIRACVTLAAKQVLGLESINDDVLLSMELMRDDSAARDRVLHTSQALNDKIKNSDKGPAVQFFDVPTTPEFAFLRGLPFYKRPENPHLQEADLDIRDELSYLTAEAGLILELIDQRELNYRCAVGSDVSHTTQPPRAKPKTNTACFREAALQSLQRMELASKWALTHELDGYVIYADGGVPVGGKPKRVMPYYVRSSSVNPTKTEREGKIPLITPGFPWREGWVSTFMASRGRGLAAGQAAEFVTGRVKPVIAQYLKAGGAEAKLAFASSGHITNNGKAKLDSLVAWAEGDPAEDHDMPKQFGGIEDLNDALRVVCEKIAKRAMTIYEQRKSKEA